MSKIKELNETVNFSLLDVIKIKIPDAKPKYYELIFSLIKKEFNKSDDEVTKKRYYSTFELTEDEIKNNKEKLDNIDVLSLYFMSVLYDSLYSINSIDINVIKEFLEYNERGLIKNNDITSYKTFQEVKDQVSMVKLSLMNKSLEKQIIKVFENDEWLILIPLTTESSVKYGYGTKWCTASLNDNSYFSQYGSTGLLVYIINKQNGQKYASYKEYFGDISFWLSNDSRVDSMQTEITKEVFDVLKKLYFSDTFETNLEKLRNMVGSDVVTDKPKIDEPIYEKSAKNYLYEEMSLLETKITE